MENMPTTPRLLVGVAALAAATLCLESALTRLLAVAQFYHFAFLVISLALLGFAASGTLLSLSERLRSLPLAHLLSGSGWAFAASVVLAYAGANLLPFDSYSIGIDPRQYAYFALYYLALSLPFLFSGLGIGAALSQAGAHSHTFYAANLLGSAAGVGVGLLLMELAGVPGALMGSIILGLALEPVISGRDGGRSAGRWRAASLVLLFAVALGLVLFAAANLRGRSPVGLVLSPYKSLSYARLYPGSRWLYGRWNATGRVDVIAQAGTRALPGLSYTFPETPPEQLGLSADGDDLSPITLVPPDQFAAASYLPEALIFTLRPGADSLVLEPGAGLGILQALANGATRVTAVAPNPLVPLAIEKVASPYNLYRNPQVQQHIASARAFLDRTGEQYTLILMPLSDAYRPVTSGAYSLHETYSLTVEAFAQALRRLSPDGILAVTRWMQTPPSESLRLAATLIEALEQDNVQEPSKALVLYRGVQTITAVVQADGWTTSELAQVRSFTVERRYDLVWAPDIRPEETNRFNRLPEASDYLRLKELFESQDREQFYTSYPFDIRPATDNHPFFFHFFTWEQIPDILAGLGRTWQPFGGSGFLVLLALLGLVIILSLVLVIAPLILPGVLMGAQNDPTPPPVNGRAERSGASSYAPLRLILLYFTLIGLAYLLVEIPLIQRWILLLGHPTYAFSMVVLAILLFSSLGSAMARARWLPRRAALSALVVCALVTPWVTQAITAATLGWPTAGRLAVSLLGLAPLGFLMGLPFPLGLRQMEGAAVSSIAWAWAVNGCASVIASVGAAILSLASGFNAVLWLGALAYAGALGVYIKWRKQ